MATKLYDLIVATSEYQDRNGNKKRNWENAGAMFRDTDSHGVEYSYIMLKRCFNPAGITAREGADAIRITLSKPKQQQQTQNAYNPQQSQTFEGWGNQQQQNNEIDFGEPASNMPPF